MPYRNGTYIAFHEDGTTDPIASDTGYYNLLKTWTELTDDDFSFVNSYDKTASVRDTNPAIQWALRDNAAQRS